MTEFQTDETASISPWSIFSRDKKEPPSSLPLEGHVLSAGSQFVSPSLPSRGVSSAYHAHDGRITSAAFKESRIGGGACVHACVCVLWCCVCVYACSWSVCGYVCVCE